MELENAAPTSPCARRLGKRGPRRLGGTMYDVLLVWWSLFLLSFVFMGFVVGCILCKLLYLFECYARLKKNRWT
jgi:hypothetical protein